MGGYCADTAIAAACSTRVRVASYPTVPDAQAYYDAWIEFYLGFYVFPPLPLVTIDYGFDTYKVNTWIHAMPRAVTDFASLAR